MARPQVFDLTDLALAGLDLVHHNGWAAVSVRSVADRLGVSPMALYRLAPDAQSLRRVIANAAAETIRPGPVSGDLLNALHTWSHDAYRRLGRYPGLSTFVIAEWTELPKWLDIVEAFLSHAKSQGIIGAPAVATVNAFYAYVLVRGQLRDTAAVAPRRRLAPVRAQRDRYPLIRQNITEYTTAQTDKHFALGLDILSNGLRSDLSEATPA